MQKFRSGTGTVIFCPLIMKFTFGEYNSNVEILEHTPQICRIFADLGLECENASFKPLFICDENTLPHAKNATGDLDVPVCQIKSGEENKNWETVQKILTAAHEAGLGRDGVFIAVGGGVIGDLCGFAASIYKRGCRYVLISTTLLGMVDASVGGKTGFDLFGIKNMIGTFYPAERVYMPVNTLSTLPKKEIKSGMAELIKTAILCGDDFVDDLIFKKEKLFNNDIETLKECIEKAVKYKGSVVESDPKEISGKRFLLNLGHTFAHALESASGLGSITHGEAVAWGIVRACELGKELGVTPFARAQKIGDMIISFGYECANPHPLAKDSKGLSNAMKSDKKNKSGKMTFVVPDTDSAKTVYLETENEKKTLEKILAIN